MTSSYQNLFGIDLRLKDLRKELKISQSDKLTEKLTKEIEKLTKEQSKVVNQINIMTLSIKYNLSSEELERAIEEWGYYRDENPNDRYITFADFLDPKY